MDDEMMEDGNMPSSRFILFISAFMKALAAFAVLIVSEICVILGMRSAGINTYTYEGSATMLYTAVCFPVILILFRFFKYLGDSKPVMLSKPQGGEVFSSVVIALGLLGFVTVFMVVLTKIGEMNTAVSDSIDQYSETMNRSSTIPRPGFDIVLEFLSSFLTVPLVEEFIFRAGVMGQLEKVIHPWSACMLSAMVFGFSHGLSVYTLILTGCAFILILFTEVVLALLKVSQKTYGIVNMVITVIMFIAFITILIVDFLSDGTLQIHISYAFICGIVLGTVYYLTSSIWCSYVVHLTFNLLGGALGSFLTSDLIGLDEMVYARFYSPLYKLELLCIPISAIVVFYLYHNRKLKAEKAKEGNTVPEYE